MTPSDLPAHASPAIKPVNSPRLQATPQLSALDIQRSNASTEIPPPPSLLSPAITPPETPGLEDGPALPHRPNSRHRTKSFAVDTSRDSHLARPKLVEELPEVECIVRARIPTTTGTEMYLHLYTNNVDQKEHLAIVFGSNIRSRSLDAERPGETEQDRMIRGAYVGRLYPGRTSSRVNALGEDARGNSGKASPLLRGLHKRQLSQTRMANPGRAEEKTADTSEHDASSPLSASSMSIADIPSIPDMTDSHVRHDAYTSPLVRIHSECYTGETVWSARCDCGEQLDEAARLMSQPSEDSTTGPGGVIVYLRQEGRGIGLSEKLKAYNLQDLGSDTYEANLLLRHPADARSYGLATAMLVDLGLGGDIGIKLLTNNPDKIRAVEGPGRQVRVRERVAMVPLAWKSGGKEGVRGVEVEGYLRAKIEQFGHLLSEPR